MITLRYVGPGEVIIGGTLLLSGETRDVPNKEAWRLTAEQPELFVIVGATDTHGQPLDGVELPADGQARTVELEALTAQLVDEHGQSLDVPAGDLADALANPGVIAHEGTPPPLEKEEEQTDGEPTRTDQSAASRRAARRRNTDA